jgi:hypothetical protein
VSWTCKAAWPPPICATNTPTGASSWLTRGSKRSTAVTAGPSNERVPRTCVTLPPTSVTPLPTNETG